MKIHDMPKEGRPRERFLKHGPETLSDAELFAILLRTGTINENVIDMSNRLIAEYGLDKLFECSLKELQQIKGIGPSKAMQILSIAEITKRHNSSKKPIKKITCAEDVFNLYHDRLKDEKQEHFIILMLNYQNNIISDEIISKGILDATITDSREIFKPAIRNSASKIILIHNHPSGDAHPSKEDIVAIKNFDKSGKILDISILDHIIFGRESYWSLKESKENT